MGYNSLPAYDVEDSGNLILGQVPSFDLSPSPGLNVNNGLIVKFIACWCFFYTWDVFGLSCFVRKISKDPREVVTLTLNLPGRSVNNLKVSDDLVVGQGNLRSDKGKCFCQGNGWSEQCQRLGHVKH